MFNNSEKGISLIITFFILTIVLAVVLSISIVLYREIKIIRSVGNSVIAFYLADSGIEKVLYYDRRDKPVGTTSGICAMCDAFNPTCPAGLSEKILNCSCEVPSGMDCDPLSCTSCQVSFSTDINGNKDYNVTVDVLVQDGISDLGINSTGEFWRTKRAIKVSSKKEEETGVLGWLGGWSHRKRIVIQNDNINGDLVDFPLYVKIVNDTDMSAAMSNGNDIRFTLYDGTTLLNYEKERWLGGGGVAAAADFWVKVPILTSANPATIYIYYGAPGVPDGQDSAGTWNTGYKGVWHFPDGLLNLSADDSTANGNDGIIKGAVVPDEGIMDGTAFFNGGYINTVGNPNSLKIDAGTISAWIKTSGAGSSYRGILVKKNAYGMFLKDNILMAYDWGSSTDETTMYNMSDNNWHHVTEVFQSGVNGGSRFYIDGSLASTFFMSVDSQSFGLEIARGGPAGGQTQLFLGLIDEPRVSGVVRQPEWVKFEFHNIAEPDNELLWGQEE
ncbi:MAG: DUF2341 domain-containing protein [Candidatus Staskawiczbacteria bacterium]|nr:DUF2341 domain-containing protein [Candidatus Staskawiczbacteria bacterium]